MLTLALLGLTEVLPRTVIAWAIAMAEHTVISDDLARWFEVIRDLARERDGLRGVGVAL